MKEALLFKIFCQNMQYSAIEFVVLMNNLWIENFKRFDLTIEYNLYIIFPLRAEWSKRLKEIIGPPFIQNF